MKNLKIVCGFFCVIISQRKLTLRPTIPRGFVLDFLMVFVKGQCRGGVVVNIIQGAAHPNEAQPARSDEATLV